MSLCSRWNLKKWRANVHDGRCRDVGGVKEVEKIALWGGSPCRIYTERERARWDRGRAGTLRSRFSIINEIIRMEKLYGFGVALIKLIRKVNNCGLIRKVKREKRRENYSHWDPPVEG